MQGDLLCCESCPGVLHAGCAGLPAVPDGDWHCPHCVCAGCGHASFGARSDLEPASAQVYIPCCSRHNGCCAPAASPLPGVLMCSVLLQ